jgi:flavodoxin I
VFVAFHFYTMRAIAFALLCSACTGNAHRETTCACYGTKSLCKAIMLSRDPQQFQSMMQPGERQLDKSVHSDPFATLLLALSPGAVRSPFGQRIATSRVPATRFATKSPQMSVGLYYSTSTGNTETIAGYIADKVGIEDWNDIGDVETDEVLAKDAIIVGAPTWHTGADKERTGTTWDEWLYETLPDLDFTGKKVAIFGCGDSAGYGDNFCDATGELYDCFTEKGAKVYGMTPAEDGIEYAETKSVRDDKFVAKTFDEDNYSDESEARVAAWIDQLKSEGFM